MSEETRKTLYLVDGTAQVFRAYFAIRNLSNDEGLPTNAVYGFTAMLLKMLREEKPDYLLVAFDLPGKTFRHDRFPAYKANRPEPPEDLNRQFPYALEVCRVLNIPVVQAESYEADDLIAAGVDLGRAAGLQVVVVASDKDLMQLVADHVTFLNPGKNVKLDPEGVKESFGVPPGLIRDVLGLMGDTVDNIPGVPGVGEKTAREMIRTYGGMEQVLDRAERFVRTWESKDRLLESIATALKGEPLPAPGLDAFTANLERLREVEPEGGLRKRYDAVLASVREERDGLEEGEKKRLQAFRKLLKGLDTGSGRKQWFSTWEHREQARMSLELATLAHDAPLGIGLESLAVREPDRRKAAALFRGLGFRTLTKQFSDAAELPEEAGAAANDSTGEETESKVDGSDPEASAAPSRSAKYETVLEKEALAQAVAACRSAGRFALDTETDNVDPMRARLVGISISTSPGTGWYIPVGHEYLGAPDQLSLETVQEVLAPLLADPAVGKVGQNLKYDTHVLRRHDLPVDGWRLDTMVAAFMLDPGRLSFKMDDLAREFLAYETIKYEEVAGKGRSRKTLDQVPVETVARYAAEDADVTLRLAEVLEERMRGSRVEKLYEEVDGPLLTILARMEADGILVDRELLEAMSVEMAGEQDRLRKEIHNLAGEPFNIDSPKQLRGVLFEKLGLTTGRKTAKSGVFSTDARTLAELAGEHPIVDKLLEYRELTKLKGTYVDALPRLIHPETGRVHTSYHPTGAATGRLSSSDPNLQNIPARTIAGLRIREAFVPEKGSVFIASDYSQVELRVLAHLCEDERLIQAFRSGEDIHSHTAATVFGVLPGMVTSEMRTRAKAVNFGILYGMSESRLAREQGMSRKEARDFIRTYFERFPNIRQYIDRVRETALTEGAVRTLFGRVRYFPILRGKAGRGQKEQALRAAVNTTIQGTAADLMKMAMIRVSRALEEGRFRSRMLLQVHDELLLEVPEDEQETICRILREEMEGVWELKVPLAVDQMTGKSWKEVT